MKMLKLMAVTMLFALAGTNILEAKNNDGCGVGAHKQGMHRDKNKICHDGCQAGYKPRSDGICFKATKSATVVPPVVPPATGATTGSSYISNQFDDPITLAFYDINNAIISNAPTTISSTSIYAPLAAVSLTATAPTGTINDFGLVNTTFTLAINPDNATVYGITMDTNPNLIIEICPNGTCA